MRNSITLVLLPFLGLVTAALPVCAQTRGPEPYTLIRSDKVGGAGGWDYVCADVDARRLYIPRGDHISVYDLDSLDVVGTIPGANNVHGVAVDPVSHHAFSTSRPLLMWDSRTLAPLKTIAAEGGPDGILFEPATERIYVLSHKAPNVTVIDGQSGDIVGTIDVGGAPEQAASDGEGHVYIDVVDKDNVAVVDAHSLKVTAHFDLAGKGGGPAGLALDARNHVLFAFCRNPNTAVILDARDGHIITTLPIGHGVDGAEFNGATGEAFSSQGDGTLTVIKETSPSDFAVEQTVGTKAGARTSTLDAKTNHVLLVTADRVSAPPAAPAAAGAPPPPDQRRDRWQMVPDSFTILVVGR
ncbi:MAG TPA: YncE family protein [Opitutaceae bacterium]